MKKLIFKYKNINLLIKIAKILIALLLENIIAIKIILQFVFILRIIIVKTWISLLKITFHKFFFFFIFKIIFYTCFNFIQKLKTVSK